MFRFWSGRFRQLFFADQSEKDLLWKEASWHHWHLNENRKLSNSKLRKKSEWSVEITAVIVRLGSLRCDTASTAEFTWTATSFHTLLSCMRICDQMPSWFKLWVLKSCHINCFKSCVLFCALALSLSKSQGKSCCASLEDYFYMRHLFSILLSFWSKIPNHAAWRAGRVRGHTGDKRRPSSSTLPHSVTDGLASLTARHRQWQNFSFSTPSHVASGAFSPPPASRSFISCSLPVQLHSGFALTPVIGWFLAVSLLLHTHSGASVVAVENRYPCLFFLFLPRLKTIELSFTQA